MRYGRQGQFLFLIGYCLKKSSPLKLLGKMEPNLAGSIYVRSSVKLLHLVPFGQQTWLPRWILFSDWLMLKKSSPLKQLGQMEAKLGRKHLCKVQTWHRWSLGVSDSPTLHSRWLLFFKVMIISLWNLLHYHSIVRWAIQAQWAEPLVLRIL